MRRAALFLFIAIILVTAAGCSGSVQVEAENPGQQQPATVEATIAEPKKPTPTQPIATAVKRLPALYIDTAIPRQLRELVLEEISEQIVENPAESDFRLEVSRSPLSEGDAIWVYALVAPFPTVRDEYSLVELQGLWKGSLAGEVGDLFLSPETLAGFTELWGRPGQDHIRIAKSGDLIDLAWAAENTLAIIPFEEISPRWKVLKVDGISPLDQPMQLDAYGLKISYQWVGDSGVSHGPILTPPGLPGSNRDPEKLTSLVLTGTTALAREIAAKMEENGVDYPLGDIAAWLQEADFTHISNEVSFYDKCPPAVPVRREMRFCSDPKFIELFDLAGVDVIEATGNHILDWGVQPFEYTLDLYQSHGFKVYGGGYNLGEARQPLILEHAGTKLALIGCNLAGPEIVWATLNSAGAAPCDLDWMEGQIRSLREEGILPVVTFQHYEVDDYVPMNLTRQHFQRMAEAGAVIVSGSQAHFPHGFGFVNDSFMHYGLGNLFFDQMFEGNRREFIDRHVFYDGRYLGVELLTAMLEDASRPRPMTTDEREKMLAKYFEVSGW